MNKQQAKADRGKPQLTLVPRQILFDIARVREYGTKKYGDPEKLFNAASTGNGGLLYEELKNAMKTRKAEEDLQNNNKQPTVNNNKEKTFEAKKK